MGGNVSPRQIALLLYYLKDVLRPPGRNKLSDGALAEKLNAAQGSPPRCRLHTNKVGGLLKRTWGLKDDEIEPLLRAIEVVARGSGSSIAANDPPAWLETKYGGKLPPESQGSSALGGDNFGPHAYTLPGAWRFFYVRPIDDAGKRKPEIRSTITIFGPATRDTKSTTFIQLSRHYQWLGTAFIRGSHLYILGGDEGSNETFLFVLNVPQKKEGLRFAGVGALLLQPPRYHQPVGGIVCFGEPLRTAATLSAAQKEAIDSAMNEGRILKRYESAIRSLVKRPIYTSKKLFRDDFTSLCDYMEKEVVINGTTNFPLTSLLVSWR